ncbi:FAD-dependent oxidoreductase [Zobellia sp. OII3]|uniref:NAD(P)/FAD-dependent oxidoreductase n=1 Tax=Zobellia sp. OII3 TaxID=2034520 RepID=UPI000B53686B|nr:NAD(P)/FAD-dependent oxidoreductase [Zobellia sp. OII3]OWW25867.1 FAD-dependent oxidoreductase [Zobellia sp. OII3]
MKHFDVIIVGGGLAGLTAAIHLAKAGHQVAVFEKKPYPHHKVCGEYVSNEVLPYLRRLGVDLNDFGAVAIDQLKFSTANGAVLEVRLPLGGTGISRYALDHLLYQRAVACGVFFAFEAVVSIEFEKSIFKLVTEKGSSYTSNIVIGAYGKRNVLDKQLDRKFIRQKSSWLAVKAHYQVEGFPGNQVGLHNFKGGYGGVSKTESGAVNFCYLTSYDSFRKEKDIGQFNANVVSGNPFLRDFLADALPLFEQPLTIAQISFHPKQPVENHILMCGDTAGLIHPLCGNGMAMAVHSAKIASELIDAFLRQGLSRKALERAYRTTWNRTFRKRLWAGRQLQGLLLHPTLSERAIAYIVKWPWLLKRMIRFTHGKPIH